MGNVVSLDLFLTHFLSPFQAEKLQVNNDKELVQSEPNCRPNYRSSRHKECENRTETDTNTIKIENQIRRTFMEW